MFPIWRPPTDNVSFNSSAFVRQAVSPPRQVQDIAAESPGNNLGFAQSLAGVHPGTDPVFSTDTHAVDDAGGAGHGGDSLFLPDQGPGQSGHVTMPTSVAACSSAISHSEVRALLRQRLLAPKEVSQARSGESKLGREALAKELLTRLTKYVSRKLANRRDPKIDWTNVKLIVTGLDGMDEKPPGKKLKTFIHLTYTRISQDEVDLLIARKNEKNHGLNRNLRHVFNRSDYDYDKTFYGQLLLFGVFAATEPKGKFPEKTAIMQLRGRIARSLEPRMTGAELSLAMQDFKPLPPRGMPGQALLPNLNE